MSTPVRGLYCSAHQDRPVLRAAAGWVHADGSACATPGATYVPTCGACGAREPAQFVFADVGGVQSLTCRSCGDVRVLDPPVWSAAMWAVACPPPLAPGDLW